MTLPLITAVEAFGGSRNSRPTKDVEAQAPSKNSTSSSSGDKKRTQARSGTPQTSTAQTSPKVGGGESLLTRGSPGQGRTLLGG